MKLPNSVNNSISIIGGVIAGMNIFLIILLFVITSIFDAGGSYLGLFTFIILPIFLITGLVLIPIGMIRKLRREKKGKVSEDKKRLVIDFNKRQHWTAMLIFTFGTFVLLLISGVGTYEAFHLTESNEFCGKLCHSVMKPEYVAYQNSTHSRVKCVECHVGPGADWFVRSKLSGLYQVYSVLADAYPRPIPTPVHNLRPAQETCEKCHWPNKFYSHRSRNEKHYLADENNTEWNIQLKLKIGSEHSAMGLQEGIHWHIHEDVKIEYIATSEDREYIPWVRYVNTSTGDTIIYMDEEDPISDEMVKNTEPGLMDCIDCHNRPSHHYLTPQDFVDFSLASEDIPSQLPEIKKLAMEIFNISFISEDSAMQVIKDKVIEFYATKYPDYINENKPKIDQAILGLQTGFKRNIFPEMKASWDAYPNQIGHTEYNGCFRCHNNTHVSKEGRSISKDCNSCHTILIQGKADSLEVAPTNDYLEFKHPVDIGESWKEYNCSECHRYLYI